MKLNSTILITGAGGEMGFALINYLSKNKKSKIITLDLQPIKNSISENIEEQFVGSVLDDKLLNDIHNQYHVLTIYHLAALLSSQASKSPEKAHDVNVNGMLKLIDFSQKQYEKHNQQIQFFFPSSIAVYGFPKQKKLKKNKCIMENQFLFPVTMYGANKLYCEFLGNYYNGKKIDFRAIRFPGIISAHTLPTGGTTDYFPEMIHAAAQNKKYTCEVNSKSKLPFMTMPDAILAINLLMKAKNSNLTQRVYNVRAFAPTVNDFILKIKSSYKDFDVNYKLNESKQGRVDSWPEDVDDMKAQNDWQWKPQHNLDRAFSDYLIKIISKKYLNTFK